jgi:hypothetical protein
MKEGVYQSADAAMLQRVRAAVGWCALKVKQNESK